MSSLSWKRSVRCFWKAPQAERVPLRGDIFRSGRAGLVWYYFRFRRPDGSGCFLDRTGYRSEGDPFCWQMTVYRESHFPDWFGPGVTYQIFPDRFLPPVHRFRRDLRNGGQPLGPPPLGRYAGMAAGPGRRDPQPGLFRRHAAGNHLQVGKTRLHGRHYPVSQPPFFESASNHRYNTADYSKIDPLLGTEADFCSLCRTAHELGMRVILDGVFNHTGSQSIYFNDDGFYLTVGASQSQDSPYFDWYSFHPWPLGLRFTVGHPHTAGGPGGQPQLSAVYRDDEDAIIRRWLRCGADGWRLDVADELPDWFIEKLRTAVEETKPEALLIGEVWEDASNKIAYSQRRRYLLGSELHGVMNYPFRTALLAYLQGGDADDFRESMESIRENYPPAAFYNSMNFLGTHDTPRIMTVLGAKHVPESKAARAAYRLSPAERPAGRPW